MTTKTKAANAEPRDGLQVPLGQTTATPDALNVLTDTDILTALARHCRGDWGECSPEDALANDRALLERARLLSVYWSTSGVKFWVITEADRSLTTVLLPDEY